MGNTKYKIHTAAEIMAMSFANEDNLWDPFFPSTGLVTLYGASDNGKSTFLRDFCLHVVSGQQTFLNHKLNPKFKKAISLNTEDSKLSLKNALNKQVGNLTRPYLSNLLFLDCSGDPVDDLDKILETSKADVVTIDPLADNISGNINDVVNVRENLNRYNVIAEKHSCLIIILHHLGKRTEYMSPDKNSLLGSQAIEAKSRVVMELRVDPQDPAYRYLSIVKGNYLPSHVKSKSLRLKFNDNLTFINTGETIDKTKLASFNKHYPNSTELKEKVIQLHLAGKPIRAIEEDMAKLYKNSPKRQTIANWLIEYKAESKALIQPEGSQPEVDLYRVKGEEA